MKLGDGGWGELRSCHCTPAWARRVKLHFKRKKKDKDNILVNIIRVILHIIPEGFDILPLK